MKVWMTIGYSDHEGDDSCDMVFTNKDKAIDHIVNFVADMWMETKNNSTDTDATEVGVGGHYKRDEFVSKTKEYINKHPEITYWYFWYGTDFWKEIFSDWDKWCDYLNDWVGLKEVEMNEEVYTPPKPKKTFEVYTTYHRTVEAENEAEAEKIAMDELCKMKGLGGEWVWSEFIDHTDKIS